MFIVVFVILMKYVCSFYVMSISSVSVNYSLNCVGFWFDWKLNSGSEYSVSMMLVMLSLLVCLCSSRNDSVIVSVGDSDMIGNMRYGGFDLIVWNSSICLFVLSSLIVSLSVSEWLLYCIC